MCIFAQALKLVVNEMNQQKDYFLKASSGNKKQALPKKGLLRWKSKRSILRLPGKDF